MVEHHITIRPQVWMMVDSTIGQPLVEPIQTSSHKVWPPGFFCFIWPTCRAQRLPSAGWFIRNLLSIILSFPKAKTPKLRTPGVKPKTFVYHLVFSKSWNTQDWLTFSGPRGESPVLDWQFFTTGLNRRRTGELRWYLYQVLNQTYMCVQPKTHK